MSTGRLEEECQREERWLHPQGDNEDLESFDVDIQ
jgi:hypothetical protein